MSGTFGTAPLKSTADSQFRKSITSPATALWNQRETITVSRDRLQALSAAIGRPSDFSLYQWAEISAFALEFRPDRIIELGRGLGNSTCCFLEVANQLGGAAACRVVSLCETDDWFTHTVPRLEAIVAPGWFAPAEIRLCDILTQDLGPFLEGAQRCLVFWDAHGFEVAEWVLSELLPRLVDRSHLVLMHDMSDTRFETVSPAYSKMGIWKGTNAEDQALWLGTVFSRVAQAISIIDFTTRNRLPLHSGAESLYSEIAADPLKMATLKALLGDQLFSLQAHWFWFTLNEAPGKLVFPTPTVPEDRSELRRETEGSQNLIEEHRQDVARLSSEKRELETLLNSVQCSAGWRMLNKWRSVRERLAPPNSFQGKFYDSIVGPLRRREHE